jgi:DNA-binding NarL/FixJ family response regulator
VIDPDRSLSQQRKDAYMPKTAYFRELREKVLNLKNHGCSNVEIAAALDIREGQVRAIINADRNG